MLNEAIASHLNISTFHYDVFCLLTSTWFPGVFFTYWRVANHIDPENIQTFVRGNVYSHEVSENKGEEKVVRKSLKGVAVKRKYRIWRFKILEIRNWVTQNDDTLRVTNSEFFL